MPGHYVEQLVLRATITKGSREWCAANLGQDRGVVVLYCTSTPAQDPMLWEVYAMTETHALLGAQGYAYVGVMPDAILSFYGMTIQAANMVGPRQILWAVYPEDVWDYAVVAQGFYCANYVEGVLDFYFQDVLTLGTATYHHIVIYGVPLNPVTGVADTDFWLRGERRYEGTLERPDWMRPPLARM